MNGKNGLPELPRGWMWTTIGELAETNPSVDKTRIDDNLQVSFVPMPAVGAETGVMDVSTTRCFSEVKKGYTPFQEGDVLFAKITPCMENGKMVVVPRLPSGYGFGSTEFHVIRPFWGISPHLVRYFVSRVDYRKEAASKMTGAVGQKRVPIDFLKQSLFPLPPLPEQHRIVAKIEELFTKLDAGVDALQKTKKLLKRYRQSVLKAAVEGKLTEEWREAHKGELEPASKLLERILEERRENTNGKYKELPPIDISGLPELPEGWVWVTLPQIGELSRGKSKHRPRDASFLYGGPHPFIQTGDIRQANGVIRRYTQTYSEEGLKQSRLWSEGTLCITIAANIGDTAILGFNACFPDSIVGFLSNPSHCNVYFIEFFLRTAKENLERYAPATAQKNINLATLNDLAVPFPSLGEQNEIAQEIERRLSIADEVESVIDAELKRAGRLRQSILKQAFSGKLVPQDPSDEPASVLLERIKEEKARREAEGKEKRKSRKTSSKSRTAKRRNDMQMELI